MRKWRWAESTSQGRTWSWTEKGHLFPKAGPKDKSRVAGVGQGAKGTHWERRSIISQWSRRKQLRLGEESWRAGMVTVRLGGHWSRTGLCREEWRARKLGSGKQVAEGEWYGVQKKGGVKPKGRVTGREMGQSGNKQWSLEWSQKPWERMDFWGCVSLMRKWGSSRRWTGPGWGCPGNQASASALPPLKALTLVRPDNVLVETPATQTSFVTPSSYSKIGDFLEEMMAPTLSIT